MRRVLLAVLAATTVLPGTARAVVDPAPGTTWTIASRTLSVPLYSDPQAYTTVLSVDFVMTAGETRYVTASLTYTNATVRTDVGTGVDCVSQLDPTVHERFVHGGNVYDRTQTTLTTYTVTTRMLFTAPAPGTYTCSVSATYRSLGAAGTVDMSGTFKYVQRVVGDAAKLQAFWGGYTSVQPGIPARVPHLTVQRADLGAATRLDVHSDMQVSNCYYVDVSHGCPNTAYVTTGVTVVNAHMYVNQFDATGALVTQSSQPQSRTIAASHHHDEMYYDILSIPLDVRTASVDVYVLDAYSSGNEFSVDGTAPITAGLSNVTVIPQT
jgi:hypothetical protein